MREMIELAVMVTVVILVGQGLALLSNYFLGKSDAQYIIKMDDEDKKMYKQALSVDNIAVFMTYAYLRYDEQVQIMGREVMEGRPFATLLVPNGEDILVKIIPVK